MTGKPNVFSRVYEAWVLKLAMVPPMAYMNSVGGGIRKKRNMIGKINTVSVFKLNKTSVMPMMKMGIDKI